MGKIMKEPNIPGTSMNLFLGEQLKEFFFNKGDKYIPEELKGWEPEDKVEYRCLYMIENGNVVLKYVDADDDDAKIERRRLINDIDKILNKMNLDDLRTLKNYIKGRF